MSSFLFNTRQTLVLENQQAVLRPLEASDFEALSRYAYHHSLWYYSAQSAATADGLNAWIAAALSQRAEGNRYPFVIIDKQSQTIAGSTSFANIALEHRRLEIGFTWLGSPFQGTKLNMACKTLLLQYAFDQLQVERVEFKTDTANLRSRKALEKLGAVEEGILRHHILLHHGAWRDTVYYSILQSEWKQRQDIKPFID